MRTTQAVIAFAMMLVGATIGLAQQVRERPLAGAARAKVLVVAVQDIDLTDDQEAKIDAIRKEYRSKNEENAKELKNLAREEVEQIQNVLTPEQRSKVKEMVEERREFKAQCLAHKLAALSELDLTESEMQKIAEIRKQYRPKTEEAAKQLEGLLTEQQKEARKEAIEADKPRREVLQALNVTSEQKAELKNVGKELKDLVGNELEKIRGVLTAEQREEVKDLRSERREMARDRVASQISNLRD